MAEKVRKHKAFKADHNSKTYYCDKAFLDKSDYPDTEEFAIMQKLIATGYTIKVKETTRKQEPSLKLADIVNAIENTGTEEQKASLSVYYTKDENGKPHMADGTNFPAFKKAYKASFGIK